MKNEMNKMLTDVNPNSKMGNLLRYYWHPIAFSDQIPNSISRKIRLLGETFILYRNISGNLCLISESCPHRGASLLNGLIDEGGIRCPYHGWKFNKDGECIDIPHLKENNRFCKKVRISTYSVKEIGGLIFAYIGGKPEPFFPNLEEYIINCKKKIKYAYIPCNWLQIMENSLDPIHLEWLHGHFNNLVNQNNPKKQFQIKENDKICFVQDETGITIKKTLVGQSEEDDDWQIGQRVIFPNILRLGETNCTTMHFRVPLDNLNTLYIWYDVEHENSENAVEIQEVKYLDSEGNIILDTIDGQDIMIFLSQGQIASRENEHLCSYDKGILMLRKLYMQQIKRIELGLDPIFVFREFVAKTTFPTIRSEKSMSILSSPFKKR